MSKGAITFNEENFEYYTPKSIVNIFGDFDYDPATTKEHADYLKISNYDTIETNGLNSDWTPYKKIWINPPFKLKYEFLEKAVQTYKEVKNDIYFLSPISFLTAKKFYKIIDGLGVKLFIPSGRISFFNQLHHDNQPPAFGCIILKIQTANEMVFFNLG